MLAQTRGFLTGNRRFALPLIAAVIILTARWIWVGGTGDFGSFFDWGTRILAGQVPGKDYIHTQMPGAEYYEAAILAIGGETLVWHQIALYLAWIALLIASWVLAGRIAGAQTAELRLAVFLFFLPLTVPAATVATPHNDLAILLAVLALLASLGRSLLCSLLAGVLFGLVLHVKQNLGLAIACTAILAVPIYWRTQLVERLGTRVVLLFIGLAVGLSGPLFYLLQHQSLADYFAQYFSSAAAGKGGIAIILGRPLPRLRLDGLAESTERRVAEAVVSLLAVSLVVWLFRRARNWRPLPAGGGRRRTLVYLGWLSLLSLVSLYPFDPLVRAGHWLAANLGQTSLQQFLVAWIYIGALALPAVLLYDARKSILASKAGLQLTREQASTLLVATVGLAAIVGQAASAVYYTYSCLPLLFPALAILAKNRLKLCAGRWQAAALFVVTVIALGPQHQPFFQKLYPLPANSPFAGLKANAYEAGGITRNYAILKPLLDGKTVLWFSLYGPLPAYGGIQVPSVAGIYSSTHTRREEEYFLQLWEKEPPEVVVRSPYVPIPNSYWLEDGRLDKWLAARFVRVVALDGLEIFFLKKN